MTKKTLVRLTSAGSVAHPPRYANKSVVKCVRVHRRQMWCVDRAHGTKGWVKKYRVGSLSSFGPDAWPVDVFDVMWCAVGALLMYGVSQRNTSMLTSRDDGEEHEEDVCDGEGEEQGSIEAVFHTSEDIWNEAWKPLRQGCASCVVKGRHLLWIQAVSEREVGPLVSIALAQLQQEISKTEKTEILTPSVLDDIFIAAAGRTAKMWLGYTPQMLLTKDALEDAVSRNTYKLNNMKEKLALYLSVLRLLRSDIISGALFNDAGESSLLFQREAVGLRSWRMFDSSANSLARGRSSQDGLLAVSPIVLQDMAICIADMVCAGYLDDVVVGLPSFSGSLDTGNQAGCLLEVSLWPSLLNASLRSTRDIQNFTNKLYLNRVLDEYYFKIVSIYEDTLQLFRIAHEGESLSIDQSQTRMRRAHELSKLEGIRYVISLGIEAFDFVTPFLKRFRDFFSAFCSWILGEVLGQGLGYIWEGANSGRRNHKKKSAKKADVSKKNLQVSLQK